MSNSFPERLRAIRDQRNMTQDELGEMIGANRVAISRYESGYIRPGSERMSLLAKSLGVTVDYLMGEEQKPEQDDDLFELRERLRRDPDLRDLFESIKKAKPEHIRAGAAFFKALESQNAKA